MSTTQQLCFNTYMDRICFTKAQLPAETSSPTVAASEGLVTEGIFDATGTILGNTFAWWVTPLDQAY